MIRAKSLIEIIREKDQVLKGDDKARIRQMFDRVAQFVLDLGNDVSREELDYLFNFALANQNTIGHSVATWMLALDETRGLSLLGHFEKCDNPDLSVGAWATIREWKSGRLDHVRAAAQRN